LGAHRGDWVDCISQGYRDLRVHELPPNGQGLAALIALGILGYHDFATHPADSADSIHLQMEAMKVAFADVHRHVADPDYMEIGVEQLLDEEYLARRAGEIQMDRAAHPQATLRTDRGTVYLCAADDGGRMVSFIQSNFHGFGSGVVVPDTGISLHNRGAGFSLEPGHPNCVAPGKRPFHTIIPGFVTDHGGRPLLAFGVMGAHMQAQGQVQMVTRIFDYGQNPQAAADAPRWFVAPDFKIAMEPGVSTGVRAELTRRGHRWMDDVDVDTGLFGGAQLVYRLNDGYCAASDHRKDGQAVGY